MYYRAEYVARQRRVREGFTRIYLYNTPVVAPPVTVGKGLALTDAGPALRDGLHPVPGRRRRAASRPT
jgi:hypothetical protein